MHLGTGSVKVTDNSGHTGLVTHGGRQVDGLLGVILREAVVKILVIPSPSNFEIQPQEKIVLTSQPFHGGG